MKGFAGNKASGSPGGSRLGCNHCREPGTSTLQSFFELPGFAFAPWLRNDRGHRYYRCPACKTVYVETADIRDGFPSLFTGYPERIRYLLFPHAEIERVMPCFDVDGRDLPRLRTAWFDNADFDLDDAANALLAGLKTNARQAARNDALLTCLQRVIVRGPREDALSASSVQRLLQFLGAAARFGAYGDAQRTKLIERLDHLLPIILGMRKRRFVLQLADCVRILALVHRHACYRPLWNRILQCLSGEEQGAVAHLLDYARQTRAPALPAGARLDGPTASVLAAAMARLEAGRASGGGDSTGRQRVRDILAEALRDLARRGHLSNEQSDLFRSWLDPQMARTVHPPAASAADTAWADAARNRRRAAVKPHAVAEESPPVPRQIIKLAAGGAVTAMIGSALLADSGIRGASVTDLDMSEYLIAAGIGFTFWWARCFHWRTALVTVCAVVLVSFAAGHAGFYAGERDRVHGLIQVGTAPYTGAGWQSLEPGDAYSAFLSAELGREGGWPFLDHLRWHAAAGVTTTHKRYYGPYYEAFSQGGALWFGWLWQIVLSVILGLVAMIAAESRIQDR